jgi:hypothetical protein
VPTTRCPTTHLWSEGLIDAIRCQPSGPGAPADVWYFGYADQSALTAAFAGLTRGDYQAGDCRAGQEFEYTTDEAAGDRVGRLRCYQIEGVASLAWTHSELSVMAVAQDSTMTFRSCARGGRPPVDTLVRPASRALDRSEPGRDGKVWQAACSGVQVACQTLSRSLAGLGSLRRRTVTSAIAAGRDNIAR